MRVGSFAWTRANPKLARFEHAHRSRRCGFGDCRQFVFDHAALSIWLRLHLEGELLIAALRIVAQILLIGLVLKGLFALKLPLCTGVAALIIILFVGWETLARQERRLSSIRGYGLNTTAMMTALILDTVFAMTKQVRPDPWFDPR